MISPIFRLIFFSKFFVLIRKQFFVKKEKMKIVNNANIDANLLTQLKSHVYDIIGCCQEVHRELGPWLNEYIYQEALKVSFEEKQ